MTTFPPDLEHAGESIPTPGSHLLDVGMTSKVMPLAAPPLVEPLRYAQIPIASKARKAAFHDSPLSVYLVETPDTKGNWKSAVARQLRDAVVHLQTTRYIRAQHALTVKEGIATVLFDAAMPDFSPPKLRMFIYMTSVLDYLLVAAISVLKMSGAFFKTPQQCRRWDEFADKHKEAMDAVIGDQKDWYISIDELFTHPTYQGRGYASALVNTVVQMADDLHRPTWLISSTPENAVFYHTFGFNTVFEIELGEGDPDWKSAPLVVPVMVRQRKERINEKYRF